METLLRTGRHWEELAVTARYDAKVLARLCGLSARQLQREYRRVLQCSPQSWLNERRMAAARSMLQAGVPVKRVAFELGFKQPSHFCRQFKSYNRLTPSEFAATRTADP
jgi:AraC family transcriptional regulator